MEREGLTRNGKQVRDNVRRGRMICESGARSETVVHTIAETPCAVPVSQLSSASTHGRPGRINLGMSVTDQCYIAHYVNTPFQYRRLNLNTDLSQPGNQAKEPVRPEAHLDKVYTNELAD